MADDNEIIDGENELIEAPARRSPFLPEEIHDLEAGGQVYVLEEEFARTRKNRNYRLYLFILAFVAVIAGGVLLFQLYRDWRDSAVEVDIADFEDLRLKEVMSSVRRRGSSIELLRMDLQAVEIAMLDKMLKVRRECHLKEMDVLGEGLSDSETNPIIARIRSECDARLKRIAASYRVWMKRKRAEIWALEEAREKEEAELAKKDADERVSNADRLYELHLKKLREKQESAADAMKRYYDDYTDFIIQKYNPVFDAQPLSGIILSKPGPSLAAGGFLKDYDPLLGEYGTSADDFAAIRKKIDDQSLLLERLMRVPYKNSVPPALRAIDGLSGSIVSDYENLWSRLVLGLSGARGLLDGYAYGYDFVLKAKREHGVVIDPRDADNILVYMSRSLDIAEGAPATVYNGNKPVGTVRLFRDREGAFRAKLVSLAKKGASVQPTNRIILGVKK
ncbi:MAG: hypothetical protein JW807_17170 [Spirochaetes bacterium]|nr:hypothetical protein [Spirochaetota bacterium]